MAAGSEKIAWSRIGVADRRRRGCGRRLTLLEVAHFGTIHRHRFVECVDCFDRRVYARRMSETETPTPEPDPEPTPPDEGDDSEGAGDDTTPDDGDTDSE